MTAASSESGMAVSDTNAARRFCRNSEQHHDDEHRADQYGVAQVARAPTRRSSPGGGGAGRASMPSRSNVGPSSARAASSARVTSSVFAPYAAESVSRTPAPPWIRASPNFGAAVPLTVRRRRAGAARRPGSRARAAPSVLGRRTAALGGSTTMRWFGVSTKPAPRTAWPHARRSATSDEREPARRQRLGVDLDLELARPRRRRRSPARRPAPSGAAAGASSRRRRAAPSASGRGRRGRSSARPWSPT